MFSITQVGLVLFLETLAEVIRSQAPGSHPIYPHLLAGSLIIPVVWLRWRAWRNQADAKRTIILQQANALNALSLEATTKKTIVGFFHPYCNAGGGGEVVLWTAVAYMQSAEPDVLCVVYTGDTDASKEDIIAKVKSRFDIDLSPSSLSFVWLKSRNLVDATTWPRFTLFGQSAGSVVLAMEALDALVPDIFIDTMGYAFTFPLVAILSKVFGRIPIGAYVHYPTISTDMLQRVKDRTSGHTNDDAVTGSVWKSRAKLIYYHIFAFLYSICLLQADQIVVNSSWTKNHVDSLLQSARKRIPFLSNPTSTGVRIVYPACQMQKLQTFALEDRQRIILSVAQFRPEKEHSAQLHALKLFYESQPALRSGPDAVRLVLVGGCRTDEDEKRVEGLRSLAKELGVEDQVEFAVNAPYATLQEWLSKSSVGISTMVDEHFGIYVVEYMVSGLIPLVNTSGGPFNDIVVPYAAPGSPAAPLPTGFHAKTPAEYAAALEKIFVQSSSADLDAMRERARESALERFGMKEFQKGWETFWEGLKPDPRAGDRKDR